MGKYQVNTVKKDAYPENHRHKLPDGSFTEGAIWHPNKDRSYPHTHLYQHDGKTLETGVTTDSPGHTHDCKPEDVVGAEAETSAPMAMGDGKGAEIPRDRNDDQDVRQYRGQTVYTKR